MEHGTGWLVTPCGDKFLALSVDVLDGGAQGEHLGRPHYDWRGTAPSLDEWAARTRQRIGDWGFNSAGAWSLPPQQLKLPSTINLELGRNAQYHWFDPFDPAAQVRLDDMAVKLTAPYRDSPYRIGYFSDNEVGWWSGALFTFYSQKPAANFTKQRWVRMLRTIYHDDWSAFAADFLPPAGVKDWDTLLIAEAVTKLRPLSDGAKAVRRWTYIVAENYYAAAARALKKADPDALYLGDRLPIYYDPDAVRAEAPHVDVISTNYNVDSPEGWIAPYFFDGLRALSNGKPIMVSEWFYAAHENRTGNRNNGHLMTVDTQAQRASGAAAAAAMFAGIPELVGLQWFQLYDYPQGGRADEEDYNFGLLDIRDRPYQELVSALTGINRNFVTMHDEALADPPPVLGAIPIPKANVNLADRNFADWPKATAQLPPLKAGPGEVAFGQVMLSWSDKGLALGTIGQDYYDFDLLAYQGAFPLSEAFRVELDVDAGGGAKRFTLYFIPPATKVKDHPPMAPKLCLGAPSEHDAADCAPVPGGEAVYFGADQPRIAAEMRVPWSALGLSGPPASGKLRIEVSSTAWFRNRWMSLTGSAPSRSAANPDLWRDAVLTSLTPG